MISQPLPRSAQPAPARRSPNPGWLAQILLAQRNGHSCLPLHLGLDALTHAALIQASFPDLARQYGSAPPRAEECDALRAELLELRRDEWQELRDLLLGARRGREAEEEALASIVAAACLGGGHLWHDLGLNSREQLRELLEYNFPQLASRNVNNMRWKKFFYKQLCEQDGGYVCRSPTCEDCPTYHDCFGEEL
ncbi:nitrogen fixation protein NifQ [Geopseudomonas sagittaria]|uniref:Nitrogen fixation protein NifQ n=1 Tax=Geopseudomonas sagittaria TaxID=1135990 RepID=A0A1I5V824_9GAMM|nr:nitrogen fixation protein NifQ [Pseudomonas sagittaria]MCM2332315.1 nitrogen fixation protein NifQ [Pseudomonas sagittaria]SFQ03517.1 nitrogen fixation protein NifQ [Pseudomonas sagittaria]